MAEWLIEDGIGETRAILTDGRSILESRIEPQGVLRAGAIIDARLVRRIAARGRGIAAWADGEAMIAPLPPGVTEGATCRIEITRPAIAEPGKPKRALARPAAPDAMPGDGPALADALSDARTVDRFGPDLFAVAGWDELIEEAETGRSPFPGGALSIHVTPAMTLIDIDGDLAPAELAVAGARAAAQAIRRLDIGGSIGIDLPTVPDKAARMAAAEAMDGVLPQPFERTAVNGFGFIQIVRRRARLSLMELYAADRATWAARALIRRAERGAGAGERTITAHPSVIAVLEQQAAWIAALSSRVGAPIALRPEPGLSISGGHVQALHN